MKDKKEQRWYKRGISLGDLPRVTESGQIQPLLDVPMQIEVVNKADQSLRRLEKKTRRF